MISIVEQEIHSVQPITPGTSPNYNKENPVAKLVKAVEDTILSAGREHYIADSLDFIFPFRKMALYGPSGGDWQVVDPRLQDNKNDFQKQNVRQFDFTEMQLVRGYAHAGDWTGPFLHVSYQPSAESILSPTKGVYTGKTVRLYLKVGKNSTGAALIIVPYNPQTDRYEVEVWGYPGGSLQASLDPKGRAALERGELIARPDLVKGSLAHFQGLAFDGLRDKAKSEGRGFEMYDYEVEHAMHPIRPLHVELAWGSEDKSLWDSQGGANYHFEFSMSLRGWKNYIGVGHSSNPHGGLGSLEYRNLYSNYFGHEARRQQELGAAWLSELGRELYQWNFDAYGRKPPPEGRELFMTVNYMDLHLVRPNSAIGVHRHRDSMEAFLLMQGKALMVTGDWAKHDARDRAFEIRTMQPGDVVLIRGGNFHGLINLLDENVSLFMFGGYD